MTIIITKPGEFIIEDEEKIIKPEMGETENYDKTISEEDVLPKKEEKKKKKEKKEKKENISSNKKLKKKEIKDEV